MGEGGMATKKEPVGQRETALEEERRRLLEAALGYVLPKGQAQKACASLLDTFGSFDSILAAPEEVLRRSAAGGPEVAEFLALVVRMCKAYLEERSWKLQRVYDTASAVDLFRPKFLGKNTEAVCMMLLDGRNRVLYNDVICEGSVSQAPLHLRQILQLCIEYHADDMFLAHNHPSGVALPSREDLLVTDRLMSALSSIGATLCDHIILAGDSFYSFRGSGMLKRQDDLVRTVQAGEMESVREMANKLLEPDG